MPSRKTKIELPKSTAQQLGSIVKSSRDIMRKDKGLSGDLDRLPMLTWVMFLKFLDDMDQVRLYFTESFTFQVYTAEASVSITT